MNNQAKRGPPSNAEERNPAVHARDGPEQVVELSLTELYPFKNHPFHVVDDSELSEETKTETSVDSNLMVDETADESLPHVTLVPPLEISDIPAGNNTLQELLEQSNEDTVTNNHVETKPDQERRNDGDAADGSDTVENQKPSGNTSAPQNTDTGAARDLKALKAQNSDFAGWLSIAGTNVDYPVVCSDNTDYYLTHTFNGTKSSLGTLFSLGKTDYGSSKNIAIYGHHITGSGQKMFKPLLSYKDKSFWSDHRTITLDTLSGTRIRMYGAETARKPPLTAPASCHMYSPRRASAIPDGWVQQVCTACAPPLTRRTPAQATWSFSRVQWAMM